MMTFSFTPMTEADARAIQQWRYKHPYDIYNLSEGEESIAEMLDIRSPHFAVRNEQGELIGFLGMGTSALVWDVEAPGIYVEERTVALGFGMRPDLTGKGLGLSFVEACVEFVREQFAPEQLLMYVLAFNQRAVRVYEKAGFERVRTFWQQNMFGRREFIEMRKKV